MTTDSENPRAGEGARGSSGRLPEMPALAPSILSADFARLGEEIAAVEQAGARLLHLDVMDGHFVPNLTIGPPVVASVRRVTRLPLDVHLMIENPDRYVESFAGAGADMISVHQETTPHLHGTVAHIRKCGAAPGVVLNPGTPLTTLQEILSELDYVLLMSVNPGFSGQKFIPSVLRKTAILKNMIEATAPGVRIEVDGGVGLSNISELQGAGAEMFVAGSAVFDGRDPRQRARELIEKLAQGSRT